jgi:hypothetical protein
MYDYIVVDAGVIIKGNGRDFQSIGKNIVVSSAATNRLCFVCSTFFSDNSRSSP